MTDKLRARAKELAERAAYLYMTSREPVELPDLIKAAILTGMREARQEGPCKTCEALARAVMTDQMGRA